MEVYTNKKDTRSATISNTKPHRNTKSQYKWPTLEYIEESILPFTDTDGLLLSPNRKIYEG